MIEIELRKVLLTIAELANKVYMLNAPELTASPYCVFTKTRSEEEYTLDGATGNRRVSFDINVYVKDHIQLLTIANQVHDKLLSLQGQTLGTFNIQLAKVEMTDFYDSTVDMGRTALELEIYY